MFSSPFYNRTIRTCTSSFGTLFKNIYLVRQNVDHDNEFYRVKVPVQMIKKEKWLARLTGDPDLTKSVEVSLPQITYSLTNMSYDSARRTQIAREIAAITSNSLESSLGKTYSGAPWNMNFSLSITTRNLDDVAQIAEQIIPYFAKDYTLAINYVPEMNIVRNTPVILQGIDFNDSFEGSFDEIRQISWDLNFTMQAWFFGPTVEQSIIMESIVNIYDSYGPFVDTDLVMYSGVGQGTYRVGDIVYQGSSLETATAVGQVANWNVNIPRLRLANTSGFFVSNVVVHGANNTYYTVQTSEIQPQQLVRIDERVVPANTPNQNSSGWYVSSNTTEWPEL
jgi:hypothetical protein